MDWKKFWDGLSGFISGEASRMVKDVGDTVDKTIEKAERKIEVVTVKAIKASVVFLLIFIGLIFALVGVSQYVTEAWNLAEGLGYVLVGAVMLLLGGFAKLIR